MIKVGQNFKVKVNTNLTGTISAMGFDVNYDATTIQFVASSILKNFNHFAANPVEPGRIAIGINHPDTIQSFQADIIEFTFKALKKGTTIIRFTPDKVYMGDVILDQTALTQQWDNANIQIDSVTGMLIMTFVIEEIA